MTDCGDFVNSDDEEDVQDLEENAEPLSLYFRYRIEHKLGHGGFSTVWMAHDIVKKKVFALKITTLARDAVDRENTSKLLPSCEAFSLPSPNGHHRVLVFPLRGPSLHSCFASMSMANRMSAAKQVLQTLKSLHDANIVHQDLNDRNIMCGIAPLDTYDVKMKYQYLGRPKKIPLQTPAGMQGELVRPIVVPPSLLTNLFYLRDFGLAMNAGTLINYKLQSPSAWCAPERLHNTDLSAASDMWSYMCVFTELYLGTLPWSIYDDALPSIVKQPESTLETIIAHARPDVSSTERAHVLFFMLKGFSYNPQHRMTAVQLLDNASF
ncbi:kinase-like protein [Lindgomyces ingoldianus]|uniref:Kinase-like protein n=1 Tax=Lindgomyces ingoldianus TaxID=673940 RepID=A0ACB6QAR9_9PLEO|nr:kinase-like protein [Lindgomyces ingoldianus]KAF2463688.1 kinase-like protein [Lindgomyces ingoldianus]